MSRQRTHHVTTSDGITIGGTVHGHGPPVVFLQGIIGDGDLDWQQLLPHLTDRFTCHLPSWRGRGLSAGSPDLRFGRLVDDVLAYVTSIADPTGLVGWSAGADLGLAAAGAWPEAVDALVCIEPVLPGLMGEREHAALGDAVARMGRLATEGRLTEAARAFAGFPFTDDDVAAADEAGYFEAAGRYVPQLLDFFQQQLEHDGPSPHDPAVLGAISAPVLVVYGSDTKSYTGAGRRHVTDHVHGARVAELPGVGHAAPLTDPEALAAAVAEFLSPAQQPA